MSKTKLQQSAKRFEALYGPHSKSHSALPSHVRALVYERMSNALKEHDGRKFKHIKIHFLKTFHPDTPDSVFTESERQAVFVTIPHIFEGEKLA